MFSYLKKNLNDPSPANLKLHFLRFGSGIGTRPCFLVLFFVLQIIHNKKYRSNKNILWNYKQIEFTHLLNESNYYNSMVI